MRNGSLLARPRPPQRDWHHVGAALTHLVTPNARAPPNRATPHDVRVHRRRGVRAGRQAARDGRPRDAGQPGRPRPPRARVPRGHQGPPRFVENPRNPRTFPTPEEIRNPTGEGGGVEAAPFPPPPGLRGETLLSARARRKPRAATPRAPRAATRARRRRLRENRAESPKVNKKGKPGAFLFTRSNHPEYDACPRRDGPGARITFSHSRARRRRPPQIKSAAVADPPPTPSPLPSRQPGNGSASGALCSSSCTRATPTATTAAATAQAAPPPAPRAPSAAPAR